MKSSGHDPLGVRKLIVLIAREIQNYAVFEIASEHDIGTPVSELIATPLAIVEFVDRVVEEATGIRMQVKTLVRYNRASLIVLGVA